MFFFDPSLFSFINVLVKRKDSVEVLLHNTSQNQIITFFSFLRNSEELQLKSLMDIFVMDLLKKTFSLDYRYQLCYNLLSIRRNIRLSVRLLIKGRPLMGTLSSLFDSALSLERECWDMFGVFFLGHPDLRRILTDYGFFGFPLRKDYPLTGFVELRFDDELRRVVFDKLEVSQEYRLFDFLSPWELRH